MAFDLIDSIAKQEMTHMGLVCNMLTGIGGIPDIVRGYKDHIVYPGPLPVGVRPELIVYLGGLTKPYVHDVLMQIEFPENGPIHFALATSPAFPTIGDFYDALADAFEKLAPAMTTTNQMNCPLVHVAPVLTFQDARAAISVIKAQGEGSPDNPFDGPELAHHYRLAELFVGAGLIASGSGFAFHGDLIPFPDTHSMAPVPAGGHTSPAAPIKGLLDGLNKIFSELLDNLDQAWRIGSQDALHLAVTNMRQLAPAAKSLLLSPLPHAENGFYGPDFRYVEPSARNNHLSGSVADPRFPDIVTLLTTLTGDDPTIGVAPHGEFWNSSYSAFMAQKTDDWGVPGSLVVKGAPDRSVLFMALSGKAPFGDTIPQMPFLANDPAGRAATAKELLMVAAWIRNNCPE